MGTKTYRKGDILIQQGNLQKFMYFIISGTIGVYKDYGTEHQFLISELNQNDFIGEMELVENEVSSASAVILSDTAEVEEISDNDYLDYFEQNPVKVYLIMKQLSERLRTTTARLDTACRVIDDMMKTEESGEKPSAWLTEKLDQFRKNYKRPY